MAGGHSCTALLFIVNAGIRPGGFFRKINAAFARVEGDPSLALPFQGRELRGGAAITGGEANNRRSRNLFPPPAMIGFDAALMADLR